MGKSAAVVVLDASLEKIADNAILMCACSTQPTTRTEAVVTYLLASVAMTAGDFSIADSPSGGRVLTVSGKDAIPIVASGSMTHVALVDNTTLYWVTLTGVQTLVAGNLLRLPSWTITQPNPV